MSSSGSEAIGSSDSESSNSEEDYYIDDETGEKVKPSAIFKPGEEEAAEEFAQIIAQLRRGVLRGPPEAKKKRPLEDVDEDEAPKKKPRVAKPASPDEDEALKKKKKPSAAAPKKVTKRAGVKKM
jgi:hypothetical protein